MFGYWERVLGKIWENVGCRLETERTLEILKNRLYSRRIIPLSGGDGFKGMSRVPLIQTAMRGGEDDNPHDKVIFEVGLPGDTWKYSVDRQSLAEKSEWFRAMLVGPFAPPPSDPPPTVAMPHVDKRAFDNLFSHIRGESVNFSGVVTARATLDIAHYYLCPELAKMAVDYLTKNLDASSVLAVYHGLHLYALGDVDTGERGPSAPPLPGDDANEIAVACTKLLIACLAVIDGAPDDVLRQEAFEELSIHEVANLARRDDLKLAKESVLFRALDRWAASDCRRRGLEPNVANKRHALSDDVWYSVRYLLMDDKEFIEGPMASGLLSSTESATIVARILGHQQQRETEMNQTVPHRLSTTPRRRKSPSKKNPAKNKSKNSGMKPGKKECEDNKKNRRKECASQSQRVCSRVGDLVVRVLACVFD
ncbi:BTB/POZ domain-containing protein 6 isoform X2 [Diachasma alloeum]|uniref:BTB/POZ domain-containing protein 6 isoform X2 n=1 Tax=Diachasma alloeum TaxID=454923 RepID=UPI0007382F9C|nr:BTB/POZ domain-containing protein 6 isoform X2 [Diachasma alloeum]